MNHDRRNLYSWGNGIYGQLGIGNETNSQPVPKKIDEFDRINKKIEKLIAAFDASASMNEDGEVYVWGKTKDGALGIFPGGSLNIDSPTLFHHISQLDSKILDIDFSKEHGGSDCEIQNIGPQTVGPPTVGPPASPQIVGPQTVGPFVGVQIVGPQQGFG